MSLRQLVPLNLVLESVGARRFLLARFPFAVGYLVEGNDVVVLAVAHQKRPLGYQASRLERH